MLDGDQREHDAAGDGIARAGEPELGQPAAAAGRGERDPARDGQRARGDARLHGAHRGGRHDGLHEAHASPGEAARDGDAGALLHARAGPRARAQAPRRPPTRALPARRRERGMGAAQRSDRRLRRCGRRRAEAAHGRLREAPAAARRAASQVLVRRSGSRCERFEHQPVRNYQRQFAHTASQEGVAAAGARQQATPHESV